MITNDHNRFLASISNDKIIFAQAARSHAMLNLVTSHGDSYCFFEMAN